jgi:glucokinase
MFSPWAGRAVLTVSSGSKPADLAAALVSLIHAYDPGVAVIGGGIMRSGKIILPSLRRHVARHAWTPWGRVKIKPAALGNDAGMLGIAWLLETRA